jgi:hypothetical protein
VFLFNIFLIIFFLTDINGDQQQQHHLAYKATCKVQMTHQPNNYTQQQHLQQKQINHQEMLLNTQNKTNSSQALGNNASQSSNKNGNEFLIAQNGLGKIFDILKMCKIFYRH